MFTFGFYNSLKGDRKYDSVQFGSIFDGIIEDGVFANVGEMFAVIPGAGLQVVVKTGRAWFNHTWNLNDSWMTLQLDNPDIIRSRIDSVVLEINSAQDVRANSIKIVKGIPANVPEPPTMTHTDELNQYRLADILVGPTASTITASNITIKVGQGETPFVIAPLKSVDISDLFNQWDSQFDDMLSSEDEKLDAWYDKTTGEFNAWFANIQAQLAGDVAANLQNQINQRLRTVEDLATHEDVINNATDKWISPSVVKENLFDLVTNGMRVGDIVYSMRDLEAETDGALLACDQREVDVTEYPGLEDCEDLTDRYQRFENVEKLNLPNYYSPYYLNNNRSSRYTIIDGQFHNECFYYMYTSYTTGAILYKLDFSKSLEAEEIANIQETGNNYMNVWYAITFKEQYIYILTITSNNWYRVDTTNNTVETLTDTLSITYPTNNASYYPTGNCVVNEDGTIDIYTFVYRAASGNSTTTDTVKFWQIRYSADLRTRTIIANSMVLSSSALTGGASSPAEGNKQYIPLMVHAVNGYNSKPYNYYNNCYVFAIFECVYDATRGINTMSTMHLYVKKNRNSNTFTESTLINFNTTQSIAYTDYLWNGIFNTSYYKYFNCIVNDENILLLVSTQKQSITVSNNDSTAIINIYGRSDNVSPIRAIYAVIISRNDLSTAKSTRFLIEGYCADNVVLYPRVSDDHTVLTYMAHSSPRIYHVDLTTMTGTNDDIYMNIFMPLRQSTNTSARVMTSIAIHVDEDTLFNSYFITGALGHESSYDNEMGYSDEVLYNLQYDIYHNGCIMKSDKFHNVRYYNIPYQGSSMQLRNASVIICKKIKHYILLVFSDYIYAIDLHKPVLPYKPYGYIKVKELEPHD